MATAQKRGFRFPWGSDAHHDEPPPAPVADEDMAPETLAHRLGVALDELGAGPFGLAGAQPATSEPDAGDAAAEANPAGLELEAEVGVRSEAREPLTASPLGLERAAWPTSDRGTGGPLAGRTSRDALAAEPPTAASSTPEGDDAVDEAAALDEPAHGAAPLKTAHTPVAPEASPAAPRRENPLVAGLVRAMRDAATAARDEALKTLHAEAAERAEAIRAKATLAVGDLRKGAEADVTAIKDWSRTELARVREETEARIAARRTRLTDDTAAAGRAADERVASLHAAVEAFEGEMARFFETLLAESDPARLAGLAESMPTAPGLDAFPLPSATVSAPARPTTARSRPRKVAPKSDPASSGDGPTSGEAPMVTEPPVEAPVAEPPVGAPVAEETADLEPQGDGVELAPEGAPEVAAEDVVEAGPRGSLDFLDDDDAAAAEAEALAGLDRRTNLIVSGLAGVAAIASFKASLVHLAGVSAVSVTAGAGADVLFAVTHDAETDIRDAMRDVEAFDIHLIADDGETLSVAAREHAA